MSAPGPGPITIADYDAQWTVRYEQERSHIALALGDRAQIIAHIGSTAVPGLAAKPVVDMLVAVADVDDEGAYAPAVLAAGYMLRVREPGHRMFHTHARDVHLHVWSAGGGEIERHLRFRDWLREHEEDRRLYERVKRELAQRPWGDSNEYAQAKSGVIAEIMTRAR